MNCLKNGRFSGFREECRNPAEYKIKSYFTGTSLARSVWASKIIL